MKSSLLLNTRSTTIEKSLSIKMSADIFKFPKQPSEYEKRIHGVVYTPTSLAEYLASRVTGLAQKVFKNRPLNILDPACGNGELLAAFPKANFNLFGVDISQAALEQVYERLAIKQGNASQRNFIKKNALFPEKSVSPSEGWSKLLKQFSMPEGFDVVIANPPWGADVAEYRSRLDEGAYKLYQAQFDTSDLFFELSANLVRPNGFIAFIVPDSIFNHDKQRVRQLILKQFKIVLIARLGEKIFPNINRACIVLIAQRVEKIQPSHAVTCFRLTPHLRKQILSGQVGFQELEDTHSYKILQSRFSKNKDSLFNIDLRSEEEDLFNKFNTKSTIGDYLTSTRGVELSKSGKIVQCSQCESWMPLPTKEDFTCQHCKTKLSLQSVKTASIITPVKQKGAVPFIAGEHIHRYSAQSKLWLNASYEGINYKSANTYQSPKLLVRKTGVGISASIDVSNAWTNQVVYIFKPLPLAKKLPLELFLGILNSRALYYYLIKKHGEIEWRSHPYLTQKQIAELPFPSLAQLSKNQKSVEIISMHVGKIIAGQRQPTLKEDAWIEKEVARLFNLTREDYKLILSSFVGLEQLAPVRAVSNLTINDIFKS